MDVNKIMAGSMNAMVIVSIVWSLILTAVFVAAVVASLTLSGWFWIAAVVVLGMAVASWVGSWMTYNNRKLLKESRW
jgi:hypothetical protein